MIRMLITILNVVKAYSQFQTIYLMNLLVISPTQDGLMLALHSAKTNCLKVLLKSRQVPPTLLRALRSSITYRL